ncbi:MAG: hypothetical protein ABIQ51_07110 [Mesorhizobium sp.]
MTTTELTLARQASPGHDVTIRHYLGSRRSLIAAGTAIAIAGLAFNWTWLVAAGIAPVLLSVLPCVAMCGLGLCMNRVTGQTCSTENVSPKAGGDSDGAAKGSG